MLFIYLSLFIMVELRRGDNRGVPDIKVWAVGGTCIVNRLDAKVPPA